MCVCMCVRVYVYMYIHIFAVYKVHIHIHVQFCLPWQNHPKFHMEPQLLWATCFNLFRSPIGFLLGYDCGPLGPTTCSDQAASCCLCRNSCASCKRFSLPSRWRAASACFCCISPSVSGPALWNSSFSIENLCKMKGKCNRVLTSNLSPFFRFEIPCRNNYQ